MVRLRRSGMRAAARLSKRLFDIVVASGVLLLASPVFLAAALAVHLSTPGPVFLRQRRLGQDGREFELLKFRSMVVNEQSDTAWLAAEDYMTPVGRILRRTSIDELPQLLNVLRGEMSLVGLRPERPFFATRFMAEVRRYNDGTAFPRELRDGPRFTASRETRRSRIVCGSITTTSNTGHSGVTSSSSRRPSAKC